MNLLAIETTGPQASVALIDEKNKLTMQGSSETMNHLQHLMPMTEQLLSKCGKQIDDVSVIAISEGPGSFTGIRIGMAAAKAMAQVLHVPIVSVPTLQSFAYHMPDFRGLVCPIFDAKRSQVYAGIYRMVDDGCCHSLMDDGAYDLEVYLDKLTEVIQQAKADQVMLFGDGIKPYGKIIADGVEGWKNSAERLSLKGDLCLMEAPEDVRYQSAASVAKLGLALLAEKRERSFYEIHPVYLRKAEAERKLEEAAGK